MGKERSLWLHFGRIDHTVLGGKKIEAFHFVIQWLPAMETWRHVCSVHDFHWIGGNEINSDPTTESGWARAGEGKVIDFLKFESFDLNGTAFPL